MTIQIRREVFETNSSSTHSITICSPEDFELLKIGECIDERLVEAYEDMENSDLDKYDKLYVTPKGERIIIFGNYGYDG